MITITVITAKGGAGKTTTAVSVASALASLGQRVLLIDADPQGNATSAVGIGFNDYKKQLYDVLEGACGAPGAIVRTHHGIDVIPADIDLAAAESGLLRKSNWHLTLSEPLEAVKRDYDFCIIDTAPHMGYVTRAALVASQYYLIPIDVADIHSIAGGRLASETAANVRENATPDLTLVGYLAVRYDRRVRLSSQMMEQAREHHGPEMFNTAIGVDAQIQYAMADGIPIHSYNPRSRAAREYLDVVEEMINRVETTRAAGF